MIRNNHFSMGWKTLNLSFNLRQSPPVNADLIPAPSSTRLQLTDRQNQWGLLVKSTSVSTVYQCFIYFLCHLLCIKRENAEGADDWKQALQCLSTSTSHLHDLSYSILLWHFSSWTHRVLTDSLIFVDLEEHYFGSEVSWSINPRVSRSILVKSVK